MRKLDFYKVGDKASCRKKILESDVEAFAKITGDYNYIHFDEEKAEKTIFEGRIVHGMLSAGLISKVIGTQLPGDGSIYLSQNIKFLKPVRINDEITVEVIVKEIIYDKYIIILETICYNQYNNIVLRGEAEIKLIG